MTFPWVPVTGPIKHHCRINRSKVTAVNGRGRSSCHYSISILFTQQEHQVMASETAQVAEPPTAGRDEEPAAEANLELEADQMDEIFDVVDETNTPVSTAARRRCHEEGLLHRSTHVFIFRSRLSIGASAPAIELLLQQRSEKKKVGASLWDVSVAEHLSAEEDYLTASTRGLQEELDLTFPADALVTVRQPYLSKQFYEEAGVLDNMFTSTFSALYDQTVNGRVRFDEAEVQAVEWWPVDRIVKKSKEKPELFTRWLLIELRNIDLVELGKRTAGEL